VRNWPTTLQSISPQSFFKAKKGAGRKKGGEKKRRGKTVSPLLKGIVILPPSEERWEKEREENLLFPLARR